MPDPIQDLTVQAVARAAQLPAEDAYWQQQRGLDLIAPDLVKDEKGRVDDEKLKGLYRRLSSTSEGVAWLRQANSAAAAKGNIDQLNAILEQSAMSQTLPDPEGAWTKMGLTLKQSARRAGMGAAAVATLPISGAQALAAVATGGDWTDTMLTDLSASAFNSEVEEQQRFGEIEYARERLGGGKIADIAASVLGQAPEMLMTGFGSAKIIGKIAGAGIATEVAGQAAAKALTPARISAAIKGTALFQGGFEGARGFMDRAVGNVAAGRDAFTANDVAAALGTAAVVFLTEGFVGGGEMRAIGAMGQRMTAAREVAVQIGQEASQEAMQQILGDLADGKYVQWDDVAWSAFAGAIGGGMFGVPAIVSAMSAGRASPATVAAVATATTAAQAPTTISNVQNLEAIRAQVEKMPGLAQMGVEHLRSMLNAAAPKAGDQHIDAADFQAIAEAKGLTEKELTLLWGAQPGAGQYTVPTNNLAIALANETPDIAGKVYEAVRAKPNAASLLEVQNSIPELAKLSQKGIEQTLSDGTKDDTEDVIDAVEQQIMATGAKKISPSMARATAEVAGMRARATAERINEAAAKAGSSTRVTPKQVNATYGPTYIVSGETQDDRGEYTPATRNITLGKKADVTTINHELMHAWIQDTQRLAADKEIGAEFTEDLRLLGEWAGKRSVSIADHAAKSDIKVTADQVALAAQNMAAVDISTTAGRAIHEAITGAYEQYLASGKSPSKVLQGVFSKMKKWFMRIYAGMLHKNATGTDLLDPEVAKVFERMLRSNDQAEAGSFKGLTPDLLKGVPPELFDKLYEAHRAEIDAEHAKLQDKLKAQFEKEDAAELKKLTTEHERALAETPIYLAREMVGTAGLDATLVKEALAGTENAGLDVTALVGEKGLKPADVATEAGYESVEQMLVDLVRAPDIKVEAAKMAQQEMDESGRLSVEERVKERADSHEYRKRLAVLENRIIAAAIAVSKDGAAVATVEANEKAAETLAAEREKWKARVDMLAEQAKLKKSAWDTESAILLREMKQSYGETIREGATYRLSKENTTPGALAKAIGAKSEKLAKAVSSGDWRSALMAHWDIEVMAEMQRQITQQVKDGAADMKRLTVESLRKDAAYDSAMMSQMAAQFVDKQPALSLNADVWSRKADAARARRTRFAAEQNLEGIRKATTEIAWAEAVAAEMERAVSLRERIGQEITKATTAEARARLATHGLPAVINTATGAVSIFGTPYEQDKFFQNNGGAANGFAKTRSADLTNVLDGIKAVMSNRAREDGKAALSAMVAQKSEGWSALSPAMENLIRQGRFEPKKWSLNTWIDVMAQIESLHATAKQRPSFEQKIDSDAAAIIGVLKTTLANRKPAKQERDMNTAERLAVASVSSAANLRTTLHELGDTGYRTLFDPLHDGEANTRGLQQRVGRMMSAAYAEYTQSDIKRMLYKTTIQGVESTGGENMSRLLMWGTETGKQRVREDLTLRGATDVDAFIATISQGVTAAEVKFLNTMWEANDLIWAFAVGAARETGQTIPRTLKPTAFTVMVDGKPVVMRGGYAAVPYRDHVGQVQLVDQKTGQLANVSVGFFNERLTEVKSRYLDLSLESQYESQMSKIRTAGFLKSAKTLSGLMSHTELRVELELKFGQNWIQRVLSHYEFAFNGFPHTGGLAGAIASNITTAVYAFNPLTAIKQPLGAINAAAHPDVGWQAMLAASWAFVQHPIALTKSMAELSFVFRDRIDAQDVDFGAPEEKLAGGKVFDKYKRAATWMMRRGQLVADAITMKASYDRALATNLAAGKDLETAKYEARRTAEKALIEVQGSAWKTEAASINQTRMGQIMTFGMKWMMNNSNFLFRTYKSMRMQDTWENRVRFTNAVFTGLVLSTTAMAIANAILKPREDELPDPEMSDYAKRVAVDLAGSPLWWTRIAANTVMDSLIDGKPTLAKVTPLEGFVSAASQMSIQTHRLFTGDDPSISKLIGATLGTGSLIIPGIPVVQSKRLIDAVASDNQDGMDVFVSAIFGWDRTPVAK